MKYFLILCFIVIYSSMEAQISIVRLDSAKWRLEQRITDQKGGGSVIYSDTGDSVTTVQKFTLLVEQKKKQIDDRILEREYQAMNDELFRATGKRYEDFLRDAVISNLVGNWTVINAGDTVAITINKQMKITGGTIRGEVKYRDPQNIEIEGVFSKPFTVAMKSPAKLEGKEVRMTKD